MPESQDPPKPVFKKRYKCHNLDFLPHCLSIKKAVKNGIHHSIFTSTLGRYKGDWKNDKKNGKGTFLTNGGHYYEGDWLDGYRHGYGTLSIRLPDDTFFLEYRGHWRRGKPHGAGWRYYDYFNTYFGFWDMGKRTGYGKMWYGDGSFYVGYWMKDKREGLGMFVQVNGNRYEGNWKDDVKHGLGRFYHLHTGQLQEGVWENNLCIKSKMSDIIIRQFGDDPTPYPIPNEHLMNSLLLLEKSELWMRHHLSKIDEKLKQCLDMMVD